MDTDMGWIWLNYNFLFTGKYRYLKKSKTKSLCLKNIPKIFQEFTKFRNHWSSYKHLLSLTVTINISLSKAHLVVYFPDFTIISAIEK